jgi:endonuclease/exonuclease/phosphatase family metal-dependent hydrolase
MPTHLKRALKYTSLLLLLVLLYLVVVLTHGTLTDYQPEQRIPLASSNPADAPQVVEDSILSFLIWNIGYGGLGAESNFSFDQGRMLFSGGAMVRPTKALSDKNHEGIFHFAKSTAADFFLFQEVDMDAKRSYGVNQFQRISEILSQFAATFSTNYQVTRVPLPILEPWNAYGRVHSGLGSWSRFQPSEATRYQLPGEFAWPTRIFQLDRCAAMFRYKMKNGKELVVFNIHNSAHDRDGELKRQEMAFLRKLFLEEYEKGNYVVAGGDWNQCPPFFQFDTFMPGKTQGYHQLNIEDGFLPDDWRWVYDPVTPSNRKAKFTYQPGETFVTIIDFFLISPNLKALSIKTLNQDFKFSDHQPVWIEVGLER